MKKIFFLILITQIVNLNLYGQNWVPAFKLGSDSMPVYKVGDKYFSITDTKDTLQVAICYRFENYYFKLDSFKLNEEDTTIINAQVRFFKENPKHKVELSGHTNKKELKRDSLLGKKRAMEVKKHFVSKGVNPSRIIIKDYKDSKPIATPKTKEGRRMNRRVEFRILPDE